MKRMHVLNTKGKLRHIQEPLQTARLLGKMVWKSGTLADDLYAVLHFNRGNGTIITIICFKTGDRRRCKTRQRRQYRGMVVVYAGDLVMVGAVKSLETWVKTLLSERSMITVNTLLIDAFERIPGMRFFEDPAYRDKLETLRDRSTWSPSQFVNISSNLLTVPLFRFSASYSSSPIFLRFWYRHSLFVDSSICLCA
nr:hypothetical protein P5630_06245 [Bacillus subtilis]